MDKLEEMVKNNWHIDIEMSKFMDIIIYDIVATKETYGSRFTFSERTPVFEVAIDNIYNKLKEHMLI